MEIPASTPFDPTPDALQVPAAVRPGSKAPWVTPTVSLLASEETEANSNPLDGNPFQEPIRFAGS